MRVCLRGWILSAGILSQLLSGQTASKKVDFRHDIQPLFKANCIGCHGPTQQMNGFRLDRRSAAMKGGTLAMIGPGNSEASRLYLRLIGNQYGLQMPPTGALSAEQIKLIKDWIDQGAEWPDDVSGETPPPPPDPKASKMMDALRDGDRQAFRRLLSEDPKTANRKGPNGSTPLMYAVLYSDADSMRLLLEAGADPNVRNEAGATALMWAVGNLEKTKLLVDHHADVNARSDAARTPLMIATGTPGAGAVVKLLLDHGADPSAHGPGLFANVSVLSGAASVGDEAMLRMLLDRGADLKSAGFMPLFFAVATHCMKCVDLLAKGASPEVLNPTMVFLAPPLNDGSEIPLLLERGADANARDPKGNTVLMLAASSDSTPVDSVKALLAHGADVNAKNPDGQTALDLAKLRGHTPVVDLLIRAGAKEGAADADPPSAAKPATSARAAVLRSLPLLQRTDAVFLKKSGCVSCHDNTLTAMTVAAARKNGFPVDDQEARSSVKTIAAFLDSWRERVLQDVGIPGDSDTISYILLGLEAGGHGPDAATDAMARFLKGQQLPNGQWVILAHRPPLESSNIEVTAASMHALQTYAPKPQRAEYEKSIQMAKEWLTKAEAATNEDRAFRLLGLTWAGADRELIRKAGRELAATQRADGGWNQLPTLESDAYATGEALVALRESGAVSVSDPAYQRGVQFLLKTQMEDGSWHVRSRAMAIQPYFDAGFPHGHDQWISATATNWATMALLAAR